MFVSFEGIDGCGKSTQAALLVERLRAAGHEVVATREPGGTPLGEGVRGLLLDGVAVTSWAEAALFAAARAQLVEEVVVPARARGAWVVCDRFLDSSLAYQGGARGLGIDRVLELNRLAIGDVVPDRTVLFAVPADVALARRAGERADRIEREGLAFAERVAAAYEELAARFPGRMRVVDGIGSPDEVAARVEAALA